jgi:hypothetical protein
MGTTLTGGTLWLLVSATVLFGFYIGDTAPSREFIREDFDGAREETRTANDPDAYLPPAARTTLLVGLAAMERLALWAHATDGTLLGDGIECLAILTILSKPGIGLLGVLR